MLKKLINWLKRKDISDVNVCLAYRAMNYEREKNNWTKNVMPVDTMLQQRFPDIPMKIIHRSIYRAHNKGYINYDGLPARGWLTAKGRAFLEAALQ